MKKQLWTKGRRTAMLLLGGIMVLGGIIASVLVLRPGSEKQDKVLFSYTVKADSDYRVRMIHNPLYDVEWLESGRAYSGTLTDEIEITLNTSFFTSETADVRAEYEIKAVLEGYQNGSGGRKPVFYREIPLRDGSYQEDASRGAEQIEVIVIEPETYRDLAAEAEQILGAPVNKELVLIFSGTYYFQTGYGEREETFTYKRLLPVIKGSEIYEIEEAEALAQDQTITEEEELPVASDIKKAFPFTCLVLAGVLLLSYTLLATRMPQEEELAEAELQQILKKYASRMILLKEQPEMGKKLEFYLEDVDKLLILAEELQKPVFYGLNEDGSVIGGRFFTFDQQCIYIVRKQPGTSTTKVVD